MALTALFARIFFSVAIIALAPALVLIVASSKLSRAYRHRRLVRPLLTTAGASLPATEHAYSRRAQSVAEGPTQCFDLFLGSFRVELSWRPLVVVGLA